MTLPMNSDPDPVTAVGHRLRVAIKMLAASESISIPELGRRTGIGGQKLSDRIEDDRKRKPTRISVEETAILADYFGMTLGELILIAQSGEGLPLRAKWELLDGGLQDAQQPSLPFRADLNSVS